MQIQKYEFQTNKLETINKLTIIENHNSFKRFSRLTYKKSGCSVRVWDPSEKIRFLYAASVCNNTYRKLRILFTNGLFQFYVF